MVTELYAEAETCYQVDEEHSILLDWVTTYHFIKQPHGSHELKEDEENAKYNEGTDLDRTKYLNGHEDCNQTQHHILCENTSDVGVLVVIDIEQTVAVDRGRLLLISHQRIVSLSVRTLQQAGEKSASLQSKSLLPSEVPTLE